jgi:arginase
MPRNMRRGHRLLMQQERSEFIQFRGSAGDRNPFGMTGAMLLGNALAKRFAADPKLVGTPQIPAERHDWATALQSARPELLQLAATYEQVFMSARSPITTMSRCACALATLPVVARLHHRAKIVWFDAHGDLNTPLTSTSGYLGGMVISGAAGLWETGLGSELQLCNVVLVGARDLDPAEQKLIDTGVVQYVKLGNDFLARLEQTIGDAQIYIHVDCDVLEPGIVPTEFTVENGLSIEELAAACELLGARDVIGLEIAEFQSVWPDSGAEASPQPIVDAITPVIKQILAR